MKQCFEARVGNLYQKLYLTNFFKFSWHPTAINCSIVLMKVKRSGTCGCLSHVCNNRVPVSCVTEMAYLSVYLTSRLPARTHAFYSLHMTAVSRKQSLQAQAVSIFIPSYLCNLFLLITIKRLKLSFCDISHCSMYDVFQPTLL